MKYSVTNPTGCVDKRSQSVIERRIAQTLHRMASRIDEVSLILTDENGPRGGVDKACRVIVSLRGLGAVTTAGRHENVLAAVDSALQRARRIILKRIKRRTTRSRKPAAEVADSSDVADAALAD